MNYLKFSILAILFVLTGSSSLAQRVALGDLTPEHKTNRWIKKNIPQLQQYDNTLIVFVHTRSIPCEESLTVINSIAEKYGNLNVHIVTKECEEHADRTFASKISDKVTFHTHAEKIFSTYEVSYVPFAIIINKKRVTEWFGNPSTITENDIAVILQKISESRSARKTYKSRK